MKMCKTRITLHIWITLHMWHVWQETQAHEEVTYIFGSRHSKHKFSPDQSSGAIVVNQGWSGPQGIFGNIWKHLCLSQLGQCCWSSGLRLRMLLNILWGTGQIPQQRIIWPQILAVPGLRSPELDKGHWVQWRLSLHWWCQSGSYEYKGVKGNLHSEQLFNISATKHVSIASVILQIENLQKFLRKWAEKKMGFYKDTP